MKRIVSVFLFFILFISIKSTAQKDGYSGTWRMTYNSITNESPINIELQLASPEKNILYPSCLKIQCDSLKAVYELLIVKKNIRQLAISKNKFALAEKPFSLGNAVNFFNGILDDSRGEKGIPALTLTQMQSNQIYKIDTAHLSDHQRIIAERINKFLKNQEISLKKINNIPLQDDRFDKILQPALSAYFGLLDTIHVQTKDGLMNLSSDKKTTSDTASITLNGQLSLDQLALNKKNHSEDIIIDTGLNILAFFADNFGNNLPSKGKLGLVFGTKKTQLSFANKEDSAASFIVAKLYFDRDKEAEKTFENYTPPALEDKPLQKNDKVLTSIVASHQQITFAIWDDAVEDGDSVSININGKWLVQGFPVNIKTQFIQLTLKPGPNTITFVADNVGSIPPNTSVLEIIDGNKRKSFTIETTPGENNLLKIFYDVKASE